MLDKGIAAVLSRIKERSFDTRQRYIEMCEKVRKDGRRHGASCSNLAHAYASAPVPEKLLLKGRANNIGIITAYNDMLSAHAPYADYPDQIKKTARSLGATAQVASGVPAMCDGVTQGQPGMELSLFSRDVIAMATAVGLSHAMFDGALCLGVCDKIVPGLLIGALSFGHLPTVFVPAGPMESGLPNPDKAKARAEFAQGLISRERLLEAEMASYHSPGTCTFYGTANSNQMLMEFMGLHVPGAAFVNPGTPLRAALTDAAVQSVACPPEGRSLSDLVSPESIVNAIVGLHATGGSTNHTIHLIAIARAAGIIITWDDFSDLGERVPLLAKVYPNGPSDINEFHAAGGLAFIISELLKAGLLIEAVPTAIGYGLADYAREPILNGGEVGWRPAVKKSLNPDIVRTVQNPFSSTGGLKVLHGNAGTAVIKISGVAAQHRKISAPAIIFEDQSELIERYKAGKLDRDFVAVLRDQGPAANGMPELHGLTPTLGVLLDKGFQVALLTDGRMSGASGKVPAAIHVTPESARGGLISRIRDGDIVHIDSENGSLAVDIRSDEPIFDESVAQAKQQSGYGREIFSKMRRDVGPATEGASTLW